MAKLHICTIPFGLTRKFENRFSSHSESSRTFRTCKEYIQFTKLISGFRIKVKLNLLSSNHMTFSIGFFTRQRLRKFYWTWLNWNLNNCQYYRMTNKLIYCKQFLINMSKLNTIICKESEVAYVTQSSFAILLNS